jgi:hypothetical protein
MRRKRQINLEGKAPNRSDAGARLTEKQYRMNKIAAAPRPLKALVR